MKKLKGFVRQEKPKGPMTERYIVYESFYYTSEYIEQIHDTPGRVVWNGQQGKDKREGELLQTNRKRCMIKSKSLVFLNFL